MKGLRRAATLLGALAVCGPLAAAATTSPAAPLNGWFPCGADTMTQRSDGDVGHSDGYYLETEDDGTTAVGRRRKGAPRGQTGEGEVHGASDTARPLKQQSFDWMFAHEGWQDQTARSVHSGGHADKRKGVASTGTTPTYECAEVRVPMCYDGVCESDKTIDVFVKRVVADEQPGDGEPAKSLWILQGGPGASSIGIEGLMTTMFYQLERKVSVYTMDHRGTGRSNRLECQAAEAMAFGSPDGTTIRLDEMPACIDDLLFQMDNQTAAYSVTSAAMDLRTVIDNYLSDTDVYVYGLSYGTYLVERLVHVAPDAVKGFIVDGIVSETGATVEERSTFSNWDRDVADVADRFLGHCLKDDFCQSKFPNVTDLTDFTLQLYDELDKAAETEGTNACADALAKYGGRPSYLLRSTFSDWLMSDPDRVAIPAVIFRASRCSDSDAQMLEELAAALSYDGTDYGYSDVDTETLLYDSDMLYYLVVFSEMWEMPTPSKATLISWYESGVAASDNYLVLPYYCLFTGSREAACQELVHLPHSNPLMYERDEFWNVTGTLPDGVTALLMSGGLDMQTRRLYGELQYKNVKGDHMLVDFEYAGHCTTFTTPTTLGGPTCGVQILTSYVQKNGDLRNVDTSCMEDLYPLDFTGDAELSLELLGTYDLYGDEEEE